MRACRIDIKNFRGISKATILLPKHGVLIGDNNTGKTTTLEALDLVLGPDRLNKYPPIDEHDFFRGKYRTEPTDVTDKTVNSDKWKLRINQLKYLILKLKSPLQI